MSNNKFCVSLTHAADDIDRATVAFVVANAAVGSGQDTVVYLSVEGARLAEKGYADDLHEEGFAPLAELMASFEEGGGKIYVCGACFKKRGLDESKIHGNASIVGGATLVEFMLGGVPSVSY